MYICIYAYISKSDNCNIIDMKIIDLLMLK